MSIEKLMQTNKDFAQKFNRRLVFESSKVANPFKFIAGLISKGLLCDESDEPEASFGLKETIVQLALMIACSKGVNAFKGLMQTLEESGNSEFIYALKAWIMEETGIDIEQKEVDSDARTSKSEIIAEEVDTSKKLNSSATKLIDKIMLRVEDDFMEQLEDHLMAKASNIVNIPEFCSKLANEKVLDEAEIQLRSALDAQSCQLTQKAIKAACSKRAITSLVFALQSSNNEGILAGTYEWLETSSVRKKNYPISVKSLASQRSKEESTSARCTFFEQAALPKGLSKLATFKCHQKSSTKGTIGVQFDRNRMMSCSTDGTLNLWNWEGNEEDPIKIAVNLKNITQFQYDEEILVLGTAEGAVHLFDARTFQEKSSAVLGDPVVWLKFAECAIIVITRRADHETMWWMKISRSDLRILNPRSLLSYLGFIGQVPGACMYPDISFVYRYQLIFLWDTNSARLMMDEKKHPRLLLAPDHVTCLNVGDSISTTKRVVVAGCIDGIIAMWNTSTYRCNQHPVKTFRGHTEAVVSLCSLNGHLLSLDKSGKLRMWSGHEVENRKAIPVARVLMENTNMTTLAAHDRWFASCSSKDDVINIWTVPDLWLRTG